MVNFIAPMCYDLDDDSSDVEDDNKSSGYSDDIKSFDVDDEPSSVVVTLVSPRRPAVAKLSRPRAAAPSPSDICFHHLHPGAIQSSGSTCACFLGFALQPHEP